ARHDPDVITLQEISPTNEPLLAALRPNYPHQHRCHYGTSYSLAVLSRLPPTSSSPMCSDVRGLAAIEITAPDGPGWVASVHLFWPWPYAQRPQVNEIAERLKALPGRKVVAGDFNQVPWSHAVKTLRRASAANYLGPRRATYSLHGIPLPIDHVLAPTGSVTRIPKHGSKHRGLLARIAFWPF
ncbi:MAG: endonuclease/exonuclease/phosphatase family protein, partial [Pseudomonadota bacterium]